MYQALKTEMENTSLISKNSMSSKVTQVHTSRGRKEGGLELIPNPEIEKKKIIIFLHVILRSLNIEGLACQ